MKKIKFLLLLLLLIPLNIMEFDAHIIERNIYSEPNDNNYLSSITIDNVNFIFETDKFEYTLHVPYSKKTLGLHYEKMNSQSLVEVVGNEELQLGNNSIALIVTAPDGTTREYDFTIIRDEDRSVVLNDSESILNELNEMGTNIVVNADGDAVDLNTDIINKLKEMNKTITFNYFDNKGETTAKMIIDGSKISNSKMIKPKIYNEVTDEKLLELFDDIDFISLSTKGTNIPDGTLYKMKIDPAEDRYFIYYYEKDLLVNKPLRVVDNNIEFELLNDKDYAIVKESLKPVKKVESFSFLVPAIIIIILFIVFAIVTRIVMLKVIKNKHNVKSE